MTDHRRYEHDPKRGETGSPVTKGREHGPHKPGERDPHEPVARPESQTPEVVGTTPDKEGMGSRPPARGERRARRAMPDETD